MSQDKYIPYKTYLTQVKLRGCQECLTAEGRVFKCLKEGNYPITNWRVQAAKGYEKFKQDVDTKYICICFSCARKKKYRKEKKEEEKKEEEKNNTPKEEESRISSLSSSSFKEKIPWKTPIMMLTPSPLDLPKYCQCGQCNPPVELSYCKGETLFVEDIPLVGKGMVSPLCLEVYRAQQEHLKQLKKEIEKKEVPGYEISHDSQFAAVELANLLKQIDGQRKLYKQFFLNKTIV